MSSERKDFLFDLIKSLSKSEKRQFKVYAGRLEGNAEAKFIALFNLLEKASNYNDSYILKSGIVKKQQLSNLKAHLYRQILISLRLAPANKNVRNGIREQLDFASVLYNKGLYKQALKILDKAKNTALEFSENNLAYEIVECEKLIEGQYITRSMESRADELVEQAGNLSEKNALTSKLSNLSLRLYSFFLKYGYVRNTEDLEYIQQYYQNNFPVIDHSRLGFREKIYLYQAGLWYNFITQNFLNCYRYAGRWVELFYSDTKMIGANPVFFLKGNHYLLEALFFLRKKSTFQEYLNRFEYWLENGAFTLNDNTRALSFLYLYSNRIHLHFMNGTFNEAREIVPEVLDKMKLNKDRIDDHHLMVLNYKIACIYFGAGDNEKSIVFLEKIIKNRTLGMREDLMCYSRILNLIAHYEAGIDYELDSLIKSTYTFLIKMNDLHLVQKELIRFLRNLGNIYPSELKAEFNRLYKELKALEKDPLESRSFLYLDILSWLESKMECIPVDKVIQRKSYQLK